VCSQECGGVKEAPSFIPHRVTSEFAVPANPYTISPIEFSLGGLPMTSPSLDQPINVEGITHVPTRFKMIVKSFFEND